MERRPPIESGPAFSFAPNPCARVLPPPDWKLVGTGVVVRKADARDVSWLLEQLKALSLFYGTQHNLYGGDVYVTKLIHTFIEGHLLLVAERDGERAGFIAGLVTPHLFNPEIKTLAEMWWWVAEEHRGSRVALMLLDEFVKYGKENAQWTTMAISQATPVRPQTLLRRGFKAQESAFLMEMENTRCQQ